jgi:Tim10/DDP family zinc finger
MQKDQFYPERSMSFQSFNQFKSQYEGVKAAHEADLSTVENCLGKCNVNFKSGGIDDRENACLRKCFVKYLDSALLIEKEMKHYVHGGNV